MTTLFSNQRFDSNGGKDRRNTDDGRVRAAEVLRLRTDGEQSKNGERAVFDLELTRAKVNIILRGVDQQIKNGDIESAEVELQKAKELEPRNLYVQAFEERLTHIKRTHPQARTKESAQRSLIAPAVGDSVTAEQPTDVSGSIKTIERLMANGEWDAALAEVLQAKQVDPKNKTVLNLEIRLNDLQIEAEKTRKIEEAKQRSNDATGSSQARSSQQEESVEQVFRRVDECIERGEFQRAWDELQNLERTSAEQHSIGILEKMLGLLTQRRDDHSAAEQLIQEAEQRLQELESLRNHYQQLPSNNQNENKDSARSLSVPPAWREKYLEAYKRCLIDIWSRGVATPEEHDSLEQLRERLEITDDEHTNLEREIQWRVYLNAIAEGCLLTQMDIDKMEQLREQFNIPAEAHIRTMKKARQEIISLINGYKDNTHPMGTTV